MKSWQIKDLLERDLTLSRQKWAGFFMGGGEVILIVAMQDLREECTFGFTCCLSEILTGMKQVLAELGEEFAVELGETLALTLFLVIVPAEPVWLEELDETGPGSCVRIRWEGCQLEQKAIKSIKLVVSLLELFLLGCRPSDLKRSCLDQK